MTNKTKIDNLQSWIFEHCYNLEDYIRAMKQCGFTEEEMVAEAKENDWDVLGVQTIFWE